MDRASTPRQKLLVFPRIFERLGDVHSAVVFQGQTYSHYATYSAEEIAQIGPLVAMSNQKTGRVESALLPGGVGYLMIPGFSLMGDEAINQAARMVRDSLCNLATRASSGWIVDLRFNGGGNIHPMLSGLGDLLGDGLVLYGLDASLKARHSWAIQDGVLTVDSASRAKVERRCQAAGTAGRIAVIIGPATRSSGQITAMAFAGRHGTRLFGEKSAEGYATNNNYYPISPDFAVNLSESLFADRLMRVYPGVVWPDETVSGTVDVVPERDPVVSAARRWVLSNSP